METNFLGYLDLFFLSSFIYPGQNTWISKMLVFTSGPASIVQHFESLELIKWYIGKRKEKILNIQFSGHLIEHSITKKKIQSI